MGRPNNLTESQLEEHRARQREHARRYRQTERGRAKNRELQARFRAANADHELATQAVKRAVRSGCLIAQPCHCGVAPANAHHHLGYDRSHRLDVVWLCPLHHARAHMAMRGEL